MPTPWPPPTGGPPSEMPEPPLTPDQVRQWGDYAGSSPLYQRLNELLAADPDLLAVLNRIENTPRQNVLLAGVRFLMARDGDRSLASFFADPGTAALDAVAAPFRRFVLENAERLVELGSTRYTQTNECRRCSALLPTVWATPFDRFHLIDLGTSAGLNLHLDRFRYRWGRVEWGPTSTVLVETEMRDGSVVPRPIEVLSRTGLDLHPVDPDDPDDRLWLESLVWPEQTDRLHRLQAALDLAGRHPVDLVAGDVLDTLGPALDRLPGGDPVIVINSFILNQLSPEDRSAVDEIVVEASRRRPVRRVSMEWLDADAPGATLEVVGPEGVRSVGHAGAHGEWLELYARP